jgi:uncharacterized alpha/beta hydrolase family protein
MTTFLTIVLLLVCINAGMMLVNHFNVNKKASTTPNKISDTTISKIYPLDLFATKYKKAV